MPVVEAVPCYLAEDSSRVSRSRPGASRDSSADTTRPPARWVSGSHTILTSFSIGRWYLTA